MMICIISSCGGHLTEVRCLKPVYQVHDHFYVINDKIKLPPDMQKKTVFIKHAERNWLILVNFLEAWKVLRQKKPDVLLSTGAGPVVPFAIISRLFLKQKIVFIETITRIEKPSLTGRLMYWLADDFYYQWKELKKYFPKGKCCGPLI